MHKTRYELERLHDRKSDSWRMMRCNLPMNTPLMLVRSRGKLVLKRLEMAQKAHIHTKVNLDQVSLL